ncbi:hypothetical protein EB155_11705, partial [archaeon]|nr:hypothetical protein [archaeon]
MADSNLNTSIAALISKLITETASANADELVKLARSAEVLDHTENTSMEIALNTRVNALVSNASVDELSQLARSIASMKEPIVQSTSVDMSSLTQDIIPANNNGINIGSASKNIDDIYANNIIVNTGTITGTPTNPTDIVNKDYVDNSSGSSIFSSDILPTTTDTYDIGSATAKFVEIHASSVKGLSLPTAGTDAASKAYVDSAVVGGTVFVTYVNGYSGQVTL